jgi:ribose transport system ATP-binding protein
VAAVAPRPARRLPGWLPLALLAVLMVSVALYTAGKSDAFLSQFNLNSLLLSTLPLALVSMGQLNALLVGRFDVSVGALMTLVVVVGSFVLDGGAWWLMALGALGMVGMGAAVGLVNAGLIRVGVPSIIATIATLSVMQGIALMLRPVPGGSYEINVMVWLTKSAGFVPYGFIGLVVLAVLWDLWLYRTRGGLATRAVGFDEGSARRMGLWARTMHVRAFVLSAVMASIAAFFLAAQVGVGDARVGSGFTLTSIAAAVLGGAGLAGGRGSFVGAVFGALFLSLIINILPFLGWSSSLGLITVGSLTLLALVLYQGGDLWTRARTAVAHLRLSAGR